MAKLLQKIIENPNSISQEILWADMVEIMREFLGTLQDINANLELIMVEIMREFLGTLQDINANLESIGMNLEEIEQFLTTKK